MKAENTHNFYTNDMSFDSFPQVEYEMNLQEDILVIFSAILSKISKSQQLCEKENCSRHKNFYNSRLVKLIFKF